MRVFLPCLLVLFAGLSPTQSSSDLRSRYGQPDVERFTPAPDVGLTVEYGSDGLACQIVIERKQPLIHVQQEEKYMKPEFVSDLIDDIVPPSSRGKEVNSFLESMGCAEGRGQEYENVWISQYFNMCVPLKPERESRATVVFKRQACPRYEPVVESSTLNF